MEMLQLTSFSTHHFLGHSHRQGDALLQNVHHTIAAAADTTRSNQNVPERYKEPNGPRDDDQNKEPDNGPKNVPTAGTHSVNKLSQLTCHAK